jgi:hypothetical protein
VGGGALGHAPLLDRERLEFQGVRVRRRGPKGIRL